MFRNKKVGAWVVSCSSCCIKVIEATSRYCTSRCSYSNLTTLTPQLSSMPMKLRALLSDTTILKSSTNCASFSSEKQANNSHKNKLKTCKSAMNSLKASPTKKWRKEFLFRLILDVNQSLTKLSKKKTFPIGLPAGKYREEYGEN